MDMAAFTDNFDNRIDNAVKSGWINPGGFICGDRSGSESDLHSDLDNVVGGNTSRRKNFLAPPSPGLDRLGTKIPANQIDIV